MDLTISLLNFNSAMIYIIHKILALIRNHLNYLEDNLFFKKYNRLPFFLKKILFLIIYNDEICKVWRRKIIKDIRNLFRLKKETKGIKFNNNN